MANDDSHAFLRLAADGIGSLLSGLTTHTPVGIFISDASGACRFVNTRWCELAGLSFDEALGDGWAQALHPDDAVRVAAEWEEAASAGRDSTISYRFLHRDGSVSWIEGYASAFHGAEGELVGWVGSCLDVSAYREADQALSRERELFRVAFDGAPVGMALIGPDGRFLRVNAALCRLLGYSAGELLQHGHRQIAHPDELAADLDWIGRLFQSATTSVGGETRYLRRDGSTFWASLSASLIEDELGEPLYVIAHIEDIHERKLAEEALRSQAERDPLTDLFNRRRLEAELARCLRRLSHQPLATASLIVLDVDRFKQVNDSLGHAAGDQALEQVARRLACRLRDSDTLARLGGDEFAVLAQTDAGERLAASLLDTIREVPFQLDGNARRLTASAGVATVRAGDDPAALFAAADHALYTAKRAGRDRLATADQARPTRAA